MVEMDLDDTIAQLRYARIRVPLAPAPGLECEYCRHIDACTRDIIARGMWGRLFNLRDTAPEPVPTESVPWVPAPAVTEGVMWESSRTAYWWDGVGEDPNRPLALCRICAEDHHERWDDMWSNVSSL